MDFLVDQNLRNPLNTMNLVGLNHLFDLVIPEIGMDLVIVSQIIQVVIFMLYQSRHIVVIRYSSVFT